MACVDHPFHYHPPCTPSRKVQDADDAGTKRALLGNDAWEGAGGGGAEAWGDQCVWNLWMRIRNTMQKGFPMVDDCVRGMNCEEIRTRACWEARVESRKFRKARAMNGQARKQVPLNQGRAIAAQKEHVLVLSDLSRLLGEGQEEGRFDTDGMCGSETLLIANTSTSREAPHTEAKVGLLVLKSDHFEPSLTSPLPDLPPLSNPSESPCMVSCCPMIAVSRACTRDEGEKTTLSFAVHHSSREDPLVPVRAPRSDAEHETIKSMFARELAFRAVFKSEVPPQSSSFNSLVKVKSNESITRTRSLPRTGSWNDLASGTRQVDFKSQYIDAWVRSASSASGDEEEEEKEEPDKEEEEEEEEEESKRVPRQIQRVDDSRRSSSLPRTGSFDSLTAMRR
eukprot:755498-Hanusia_phi.AAC.1